MFNHRSYKLLLIILAFGVLLLIGGALVVTVAQIPLNGAFTADIPDCGPGGSVPGVEQCTQAKCQLDGKNLNTGYFCDCVATQVTCCTTRDPKTQKCLIQGPPKQGKYYSCKYNTGACPLPSGQSASSSSKSASASTTKSNSKSSGSTNSKSNQCAPIFSDQGCGAGKLIGDSCGANAVCEHTGGYSPGTGRMICACKQKTTSSTSTSASATASSSRSAGIKPSSGANVGTTAPTAPVEDDDKVAVIKDTMSAAYLITLTQTSQILIDVLK